MVCCESRASPATTSSPRARRRPRRSLARTAGSRGWSRWWLARRPSRPRVRVEFDVQGIHCAACVWLMNELFRRQQGGAGLTVNPALGTVRMQWRRGAFDVGGFLRAVEGFGYLFGPQPQAPRGRQSGPAHPPRHLRRARHERDAVLRELLCRAHAGAIPTSSGSSATGLALSTGVVLVGGWPFFRSAVEALRRGVMHLDLPIALGILLLYGTSLVQARGGRGDLAYFDTLNTFVTLMLVGRWLQERVLERNRRFLLDDDGAEGLSSAGRRVSGSPPCAPPRWARATCS